MGDPWWLNEMRHTVESLVEQLTPASREAFDSDAVLQCCIERHIAHLGEQASKLSAELKAELPEVPWETMYSMRTTLVHRYWAVDRNSVWTTLTTAVPELRRQLKEIRL